MRLAIITAYAGSEKLADMTMNMLRQLYPCISRAKDRFDLQTEIVVVNNASKIKIDIGTDFTRVDLPENWGCARGFNRGYEALLREPDYVLVMNNDLEFPQVAWLVKLLEAALGSFVACPTTNSTASAEARAPRPEDKSPTPCYSVSAYCWLIPIRFIEFLKKEHGFPIFDPDFVKAYGEDNWTALLWQQNYGPQPFNVVHRSWVKHLKAQTAKELVTAKERQVSTQVLKNKINLLLRKPDKLRGDVQKRCRWYLKVLS